jgi:two-component system NarL family sensor kinase
MAAESPGQALEGLRERYRELLERLETNQSDFQRLARSVFRVQEDERRRIARELHDGIGQNLTAIKHQLAIIRAGFQDESIQATKLDACLGLCTQTLEDTRQLSRLLRPQVLDDLGLEAALQWLVRSVTGDRLRVELHVDPLPALDPDLQTLLFRIAQEALNNVVRHAQARDAMLRLSQRAGLLQLTVWDNGVGFDAAQALRAGSAGLAAGLSGMRERLRLHDGTLQLDSGGDNGTWLRASVPLPGPAPDASADAAAP